VSVIKFAPTDATAGRNSYFGRRIDLQQGWRGSNLVVEFRYKTAESSGETTSQDWLFVARDASIPPLEIASQGTNTLTTSALAAVVAEDGTTSVYKAPAVGDAVMLTDTSNNTYLRYITVVTGTANAGGTPVITYSGSDLTLPTGTTVNATAMPGIFTSLTQYLPEADSEGKTFKAQVKTDTDTKTIEYGIMHISTQTDQQIYVDNILLSANKFLQASSQTKNESYSAAYQNNFLDSTSTGFLWGPTLPLPIGGSPPLANSKFVSIGDITSGTDTVTAITAKQDITLSVTIGFDGQATGEIKIYNSDAGIIGFQGPVAGSVSVYETSVTINLSKDDYIYFNFKNPNSAYGLINFTAQPQTSDVILLESQDEIFTGWTEFTPVCGLTGGTKSLNKGYWRRVGSEMEVRISVAWSSKFTGGTATFDLPSGYAIDTSVIPTPLAANETDFGHAVVWDDSAGIPAEGRVKYSDTDTVKATWLDQAQTTYAAVINPGGTLSTQSGGWISTVSGTSGSYTIGFTANFFGEAPSIQVTAASSTHARIGQVGSISSSTAAIYTMNASTGNATSNDVSVIHVTATRQGSDFENDEFVGGGGAIGTGLPFTIADNDAVNLEFKVPIAGWNANFNPLLSLPLVDTGAEQEQIWVHQWNGAATYSVYSTTFTSTLDKLATLTNSSTEGFFITAKQNLIVNASFTQRANNVASYNTIVKGPSTMWDISVDAGHSTYDNYIVASQDNEQGYGGNTCVEVAVNAGEIVGFIRTVTNTPYADDHTGGSVISVRKNHSNNNLAHIIKPAVAILRDVKSVGTTGGEVTDSMDDTVQKRDLNTIYGDSWFVTLSANVFTLEPGTYKFNCSAPFYQTHYTTLGLYDVSNSAWINAATARTYFPASQTGHLAFDHVMTITASTQFQLGYTVMNGHDHSSWNLGVGQTYTAAEAISVFAEVMIEKLK
jgi:hypothetical protein